MLKRKISKEIEEHLLSKTGSDKIMVIEGARQIGKSFIIREVGKRLFKNFVEINFVEDDAGAQLFKNLRTTEEFYLTLSMASGKQLGTFEDTLVFIDEVQHYPHYLTLLKFLREDHRFRFIASGSLLGIALRSTTSIPIGSIVRRKMHQLDFEEFLTACGVGDEAIASWRGNFERRESLSEEQHKFLMGLFQRYLLVGGMPDAVNAYLATQNIVNVREVQNNIHQLYGIDASKYEKSGGRNLLIRRIYGMIPSQMENKKRRIVAKEIRDVKGDRLTQYQEEFEYLLSSGTALGVHAISNPRFPLSESAVKNLLKLYLNDVGILTAQLYRHNIQPILNDERSVNIGAVYENAVAQELAAHGFNMFYYDNRQKGEVDFLIDDYSATSVLPIEVKSGKDYTVHSALNNLLSTPDYDISSAIVLSNNREVRMRGNITYLPIYFVMFLDHKIKGVESLKF